MWCFDEGSGWWMPFGWLWFTVFWGAIIALGIWIVRKLTNTDGPEESNFALEIAKKRYSNGEISREEFEQIKRDIS